MRVAEPWARRPPLRLAEVDSTQTEARRLAAAGAPEGTVVQAEHQRRGRGRLGRAWTDEPGSALLVSIVLRPGTEISRLPQLSLVAGVAAAEAIGQVSGLSPTLDWPNDLMLGGRKVAGILAESFATGSEGTIVIVGIGVNVNQTRFADGLGGRATSLALEAGRAFDREALLETLLERFEAWYRRWAVEGFAPIRAAWLGMATLGGRVAGDPGDAGTAVDLDLDGALLVKTDAGALVRRVAGGPAWGGDDAARD